MITITVGGNDISSAVRVESIKVEQVASRSGVVATASFECVDDGASLSIAAKDAVVIDDGGTTYFKGEVAGAPEREEIAPDKLIWYVECQDYNQLLRETVVPSESYAQGEADSDTIDDLFSTYRSDINSTTYVSTVDGSMEAIEFKAQSLARALGDICKRTGSRFYVDFDKNLHYYDDTANVAAAGLSDSYDGVNTFRYWGLRRLGDVGIVNRVYVVGKELAIWSEDAASVAAYGEREAVVKDRGITTAQGAADRGTAYLAANKDPAETYELKTLKGGFEAGQKVELTSSVYSLSAQEFLILSITTTFLRGDLPVYALVVGDDVLDAASSQGTVLDQVDAVEGEISTIGDSVFDTDAPAAPSFVGGNITTGVSEDADGHQMVWIRVTWGSVADDDLDHYEVQCADNSSFNWPRIQHVQAGDTREVVFEGLVGNTDHYLRVRAVDWVGNYSAWSPQPDGYLTQTSAADTTAPAQVANLSAASSRTLVGLQWDANSEADLSHYEIQRADDDSGSPGTWGTIATAKLNYYVDQDFTDGEISAEDTFWYRVRAVDTSGNEGDWATQTSMSLNRLKDDHIAANTITAASIAADTITASEIVANTITASEIAANTITATELNVSMLSAITADMGTLTAGEIRVGTGTPGVDFTGFRVMSTYLAGYNDDTLQAGIRVSDGKWVAGGGTVVGGEDGIIINSDANAAYLIFQSSGTDKASIYYYDGLRIGSPAGALGNYRQLSIDDDEAYLNCDFRIGPMPLMDGVTVWINDSANANMGAGLTINQGAHDDEILALKSSDVAHGMTGITETDTFGFAEKAHATKGGLRLRGLTEGKYAIALNAISTNDNTAKSTSALANAMITASKKSGTSWTTPGSNANLLAIASHTNTRFVFDQEGEMHCDAAIGGGNDWDEWDDLALAADLSRLPQAKWREMMRYSAEDFERAGLLSLSEDEEGRHAFIRVKAHLQFYACCFREVGRRLARYEDALIGLGIDPKLVAY